MSFLFVSFSIASPSIPRRPNYCPLRCCVLRQRRSLWLRTCESQVLDSILFENLRRENLCLKDVSTDAPNEVEIRMLNLKETVFCETELFYETAFNCRALDGYNSILCVSDRLRLARRIFLKYRGNG